ncbi:MAG TPA: hypothetical protein PLV17_06455 [Spirochaetota bacterium]|nr:hypothetical protein [Spirochaetota bacterium]
MKANRILLIIFLLSHVMIFSSNSQNDAELFLNKDKLEKLDRVPDESLSMAQEVIYIESMEKKGIKLSMEDILSTREERYVYVYKKTEVLKKTKKGRIVREVEYYESGNIKRYSVEHIIRVNNNKRSYDETVKMYSMSYIDDAEHQIEKRYFSTDTEGTHSYYSVEYIDGNIVKSEFYSKDMSIVNFFKDGKIEKVNISGFNLENPISSFIDN